MIHFISDLHLSPRSAGATHLFLAYLAGPARQATDLYILGDLFEAWIGDDGTDLAHDPVVIALRQASDAGLAIHFLHGNRDFLVGDAFCRATGLDCLPDPYVLSTPEWQFVLSHGDALCTHDPAYNALRAQMRDPAWQTAFLARPLAERQAFAAKLRAESEQAKSDKAAYLMDLHAGETDDFLRQFGYATFIHGHTHLPATHDHIVDGIHVERWVLADWHDDRGEYLAWDGEGLSRHPVTLSA